METQSLFRLNWYLFCSSVSLIAMIVSGCAAPKGKMYLGEEVEDSKRAVIRSEQWSSGQKIVDIRRVDGKGTGDLLTFFFSGKSAGEVYVLPGKHNIIVEARYVSAYAVADLGLVAEPGEIYVVRARTEGYRIKIWIENERTGQPVGTVN